MMAFASKIVLAVAALGTSCILYDMAKADDVPDALSVGHKAIVTSSASVTKVKCDSNI